jgi:magnesium transporter
MPLFGEIFFSEVLKKPVLDPKGNVVGTVKDALIVKGDPLPKIDAFIVTKKNHDYLLDWQEINIFNRKVISTYTSESLLKPYVPDDEDLLAARDLIDKQILDVNGIKVVRVNDIKIEGFKEDAVFIAVDVGVRGILRRLGVENQAEGITRFFQYEMPYNLISWNYIQPLRPKLKSITLTIPRQMVSELHPADIAEIISQVSREEGAHLFKDLDLETAAETLSELQPEMQAQIIEAMDAEKAADIIEEMPPDEAADVLSDLSSAKAKEILEHIEKEEAEDIQELLSHEDDSAGGLMTNEFAAYNQDLTVAEVIEKLKQDANQTETVYYIYVVDENERLAGVLSLRELIISEHSKKLFEIMTTKVRTVKADTDDFEVANITAKYNLVALPVVDDEGKLIGIITVDDIIDMIMPPAAKKKRKFL